MSGKPTKMSIKQRKFARHYAQHGNGTKAALYAFNCKNDNSAAVLAYLLIRKLKIPISEMLDAQGVTDEAISKVYREGMNAVKPEFKRNKDGVFEAIGESPDHAIRLKSADSASKMKGHLRNDINLNLPPEVTIQLDSDHVPIPTEPESTE